jgi:hypothetical protein
VREPSVPPPVILPILLGCRSPALARGVGDRMRRPLFGLFLLVGILVTPTAALAQSSCSEIQIGSSYTSYSCSSPSGTYVTGSQTRIGSNYTSDSFSGITTSGELIYGSGSSTRIGSYTSGSYSGTIGGDSFNASTSSTRIGSMDVGSYSGTVNSGSSSSSFSGSTTCYRYTSTTRC